MIDGETNKKRTIVAKLLNIKDKKEVLSEYRAQNLKTKGIFINNGFSEDNIEKCKGLSQRAKELCEEGKTAQGWQSMIG